MEIDLIMKPKEWKNGCGMKLSFGSKGSQYYLALLADHYFYVLSDQVKKNVGPSGNSVHLAAE